MPVKKSAYLILLKELPQKEVNHISTILMKSNITAPQVFLMAHPIATPIPKHNHYPYF